MDGDIKIGNLCIPNNNTYIAVLTNNKFSLKYFENNIQAENILLFLENVSILLI